MTFEVNAEVARLRKEIEVLQRFVPFALREAIASDSLDSIFCRQICDLTVLFTDIANCTNLCEWLPPDRMQEFIEEYVSSFIDEVHEFGGTINEIAGDGLMILFFEGSTEEHARAAVRTASLIQTRTREFQVCREDKCKDLAVHIGINSGTASLGLLEFRGKRGRRTTYTATGPVTNVATRLAGLAPAYKTYVGRETWIRLRGAFAGTYVGRFQLRNVSYPVEVYETLEPSLS